MHGTYRRFSRLGLPLGFHGSSMMMTEAIRLFRLRRAIRMKVNAQRKDEYRTMLHDVSRPWCWGCGRGASFADKPPDWFGPWLIERAHIVRKPRREDRRAVVLLCSLCHKAGCHGERIILDGERVDRPKLELEHLLWLKLFFDPGFYDREFLQANCIQRLPLPRKLPLIYRAEYEARRGGLALT